MDSITLPTLLLPPSVNDAYFNQLVQKTSQCYPIRTYRDLLLKITSKRTKSGEANKYCQQVAWTLNETGTTTKLREFIEEHVTVEMWLYVYREKWLTIGGLPNKNAGDSDNRIKILKDIIFKTIGIDDCVVFADHIRKLHGEEKVIVRFTEVSEVSDEF